MASKRKPRGAQPAGSKKRRGPGPEACALKLILAALAAQRACKFWRNNTGAVRVGARFVKYGLCKGSADIIGIVTNDVGKGIFVALEVKAPKGRATPEQIDFLSEVRSFGGIAAIVRTVDEALLCVEAARKS